jgi:hypothetical protein
VDEAIDRHLIRVSRDRPSRGVAPELEPDPEALEINGELVHLERRRQALTAELDELNSTVR